MSDFNQVVLIGRCGNSPEVIQVNGKQPFAKVQIATNKKWKKDNVTNTRTDWHTVIFNRKLAELAEKYLHKGDLVLVKGELQSRKWQDKDGKDRLSVSVQAQELRFLTAKPKQETTAKQEFSSAPDFADTEAPDEVDGEYADDIPC